MRLSPTPIQKLATIHSWIAFCTNSNRSNWTNRMWANIRTTHHTVRTLMNVPLSNRTTIRSIRMQAWIIRIRIYRANRRRINGCRHTTSTHHWNRSINVPMAIALAKNRCGPQHNRHQTALSATTQKTNSKSPHRRRPICGKLPIPSCHRHR